MRLDLSFGRELAVLAGSSLVYALFYVNDELWEHLSRSLGPAILLVWVAGLPTAFGFLGQRFVGARLGTSKIAISGAPIAAHAGIIFWHSLGPFGPRIEQPAFTLMLFTQVFFVYVGAVIGGDASTRKDAGASRRTS